MIDLSAFYGLRFAPELFYFRKSVKAMKIRFESDLAKELYMEVSALADMKKVDRSYISLSYIWKVWRKVYRLRFGSTRHIYLPGELFSDRNDNGDNAV